MKIILIVGLWILATFSIALAKVMNGPENEKAREQIRKLSER